LRLRSRTVVLLSFAVTVAISGLPGGPALASHNADDHSDNITYEGTSVQNAFTNSDLAFWGDLSFAGNYGGFRVFDISDPTAVEDPTNLVANVSCPGNQFDVSVWDTNDGDPEADILIASVEAPRTNDTCTSAGTTASDVNSWEGLRIFDIDDLNNITQIAAVPTDCGSHTHTIAGEDATYVYVYVASYPLGSGAVTTSIPARNDVMVGAQQFDFPAGVRNNGTECLEPEAGEAKPNGVHDKISIVRIPLADPTAADDRTPNAPGAGGDPTNWIYTNVKEVTLPLNGEVSHINVGGRYFDISACHDINTFFAIDRAAGACFKEGIIWDITDPWSPLYLRRVRNQFVDTLFHSATFSWDGKIIVFEDEAGGGGEARCKLEDGEPDNQGAMYFYKMNGELQGIFKIPRHINGICTAHNYNTVPTTDGRRITVSAWYRGGTSVIDYTDPTNPVEIGHYINKSMPNDPLTPTPPGPPDLSSDQWSSYWYNGFIHVNDRGRGYEVYSMTSPKLDSAMDLPHLNPQVQEDLIPQTIPTCKGEQATMWGTAADDDDLIGTTGDDVIVGGAGNDTITAGDGNDLVCAGGGADTVNGGPGNDRLFGEDGRDSLNGGFGRDFCHGGLGRDEGRSCENERSIP
jgi:hypothetical protein